MSREDEIRSLAYDLWEKAGRPDGQDLEFWLKAEALWEEKNNPTQISIYPLAYQS